MCPSSSRRFPRPRLLLLAIAIALISPLPYAGSWNDGSRLASMEALVDYHTWSIDHSIFANTPGVSDPKAVSPYSKSEEDKNLVENGTKDKMLIKGHYYSDKSPVPSLAMAGVYKALQFFTGLKAAHDPAMFCYLITLFFCGTAYVISVCCADEMAAALELPCGARLLLPYGFALATVALPYARAVNNHILLLAVFSCAMCAAWKFIEPAGRTWQRLVWLGTLAGIGYTIDLGAGPVFVLAVTGFVAAQSRSLKVVVLMLAAAFPWFLLHHAFNYMIGGTFKPANAVPDYFLWPGSGFNASNLTGGWAHPNVLHFFKYAPGMLFGKKGFICHNIALYACIPAIPFLLRHKGRETVFVVSALGLIAGTWLIYAATSNNYSGLCCSIRWFVPLLAPFYWLLAIFLKKRPDYTVDVLILTGWGVVLGILMWIKGPWIKHMVPGYVYIEIAALVCWLLWRFLRWKMDTAATRAPGE